MRAPLAIFVLCPLAVAAPVPKETEKPKVEVQLGGDTTILKITIVNNGKESLELPYKASQWELVRIELRGANGKQLVREFLESDYTNPKPDKLTIAASGTKTLEYHICHSVPIISPRGEPFTVSVKFRCGDKTIEAKPLVLR